MADAAIETRLRNYDGPTIAFHWAVAALILALWIAGQLIDDLPKGAIRENLWATHVVSGLGLALVFLARLTWRLTSGLRLPDIGPSPIRQLAKIVHWALYALLAVVIGLGIANAFNRGYRLYGLATLPQIGDPTLKHALTEWHGFAANVLLGLALFHAIAALLHHYIWKDEVLLRMLPGSDSL